MYDVQPHPLLLSQDLNSEVLPPSLVEDFLELYKADLERNPYPGSSRIRKHYLANPPLQGYYAVDITWQEEWEGERFRLEYRIVYWIDDVNRKVVVISFDRHDVAYDKAKQRTRGGRLYRQQNRN
jgi:mRNA-degrading endonuclease RelE of RelBE toxin-antitoxin system